LNFISKSLCDIYYIKLPHHGKRKVERQFHLEQKPQGN